MLRLGEGAMCEYMKVIQLGEVRIARRIVSAERVPCILGAYAL